MCSDFLQETNKKTIDECISLVYEYLSVSCPSVTFGKSLPCPTLSDGLIGIIFPNFLKVFSLDGIEVIRYITPLYSCSGGGMADALG